MADPTRLSPPKPVRGAYSDSDYDPVYAASKEGNQAAKRANKAWDRQADEFVRDPGWDKGPKEKEAYRKATDATTDALKDIYDKRNKELGDMRRGKTLTE